MTKTATKKKKTKKIVKKAATKKAAKKVVKKAPQSAELTKEQTLSLLQGNGPLTLAEIRERSGNPSHQIRYALTKLREEGKVEMEGTTRQATYNAIA